MAREKLASEAFDAIHDEALKLLQIEDLPHNAKEGLRRIVALARYQFDIRSEREK
ncbi:MAG: hypothetical protein JWM21_3636 [Acidobacteria bacterium]|nr:hypothetical protein [Acidobacteriota bacterium]